MSEEAKPTKTTGRYRKVEVRTWGDEKFRSLSPIPPCGQGLWLFLITGPHTSPIPGLFRAGRAAMAEELGWELEAFDKAFGEALRQGMVQADFKARVVWVPNAIRHNRPESPNVVKSWATEFDLIPECDLKRKAYEALKASIHAIGEAFGKAFDEAFANPSQKACVKTMPNQEQEQEQEQKNPPTPRKRGNVRGFPPGFETFWSSYPKKLAKDAAAKAFARLNADDSMLHRMLSALDAQRESPQWLKDGGQFIPNAATWLNGKRWNDEMTGAAPPKPWEGAA